MILLDTNIISELMKAAIDPKVKNWIDHQDVLQLYISTVTIAEIAYGINVLPAGKKRIAMEKAFNNVVREAFEYRIFTFDEVSAHLYGIIMGQRRSLGKPMSMPDGQIAAIARAHNCTLATRNTDDFSNCEVEIINPFF